MQKIFIFLFVILLSFNADAREIYNVKDIPVYQKAKDANEAREIALKAGERKAYEELSKRFVDYGYLDETPKLNEKQLAEIVVQMKIRDERINDTSYAAKLDFWFNPRRTAALFKVKNVNGTPIGAKQLIIPILLDKGEQKIWNHAWLNSWSNYKSDKIIVPVGDLEDIQTLKPKAMASGDYQGLDKLTRRYRAPIIILARAEYTILSNSLAVNLEILEGKNSNIYYYEYEGGFGVGADELYDTAANDLLYRIKNNKFEDGQAELDEKDGVDKTEYYRNYDDDRKYKYSRFKAIVKTANLAEWSRIRRRLIASEYVEELEVLSFTRGEALVEIVYNGNISLFAPSLAKNNLVLEEQEGTGWIIREMLSSEKVDESEDEESDSELESRPKVNRKREVYLDEEKKFIVEEEDTSNAVKEDKLSTEETIEKLPKFIPKTENEVDTKTKINNLPKIKAYEGGEQ